MLEYETAGMVARPSSPMPPRRCTALRDARVSAGGDDEQRPPATLAALDLFELRSAFDLVLTRDEVPMKPDPTGITHAMATFDIGAGAHGDGGRLLAGRRGGARAGGAVHRVSAARGHPGRARRAVLGDRGAAGRASPLLAGAWPTVVSMAGSMTAGDALAVTAVGDASGRRWPGCIGFSDWERGVGWNRDAAPDEAWKLGRTRALLDLAGAPDRDLRIVHVAGTKGKGSTGRVPGGDRSGGGLANGGVHPAASAHLPRAHPAGRPADRARSGSRDGVDRLRGLVDRLAARHPDAGDPTTFELTTALAVLAGGRGAASTC